jgi:multidrug efflux system membrane fusion protein
MKSTSGQSVGYAGHAVLITLSVLLASCSGKPDEKKVPTVPVIVAQAESKDVPVEVHAIGNVQAYSSVSVRSQITGVLMRVHFREGQDVNAGDMLFTIDPRPSEAALNQARANASKDEAQLVSARLEFERTKKLFEGSVASRDEYDKAEAAFRAVEATVVADNAAVSNAALSLEYTAIRSPIDGRTGSVAVKEGNLVKAEDDRLVTINQIHPVYVSFSVPEQHLSAIRRRMSEAALPVEAVAPGETNSPSHGELTFVDNTVDITTGTALLKGTFPNTDTVLWPGQFVQVTLTVSNLLQATVVPSQTVQASQSGDFVFVVKPDSTVEKRMIETGIMREGTIVIQQGVRPGETVVTDGQMKLVPGTKVTAQKPGETRGTMAETR